MAEISEILRRHSVAVQEMVETLGLPFDSVRTTVEKRLEWILSSDSFSLESRRLTLAAVSALSKNLRPRKEAIRTIALAEATQDSLLADTLYQIDWNGIEAIKVGQKQCLKKTVVQQNCARAKRVIVPLKIHERIIGKVRQKSLDDATIGKLKSFNLLEATILCNAFAASWREIASELRIVVGPRSLKPSFGRFWVEETQRTPAAPAIGKQIAETHASYFLTKQFLVKGRTDEFEMRVSIGGGETSFFWISGSSLGVVSDKGSWMGEVNEHNPLLIIQNVDTSNEYSLRTMPG